MVYVGTRLRVRNLIEADAKIALRTVVTREHAVGEQRGAGGQAFPATGVTAEGLTNSPAPGGVGAGEKVVVFGSNQEFACGRREDGELMVAHAANYPAWMRLRNVPIAAGRRKNHGPGHAVGKEIAFIWMGWNLPANQMPGGNKVLTPESVRIGIGHELYYSARVADVWWAT